MGGGSHRNRNKGRKGGRGRGPGGQSNTAPSQAAHPPVAASPGPTDDALIVVFSGSPAALQLAVNPPAAAPAADGNKESVAACPAKVDPDSADASTLRLQLPSWGDLGKLLTWFGDAAAGVDKEASLGFSSALSKAARAQVHAATKDVGAGALVSLSRGVGEARSVVVAQKGSAAALAAAAANAEVEPDAAEQAQLLYRWAREAGEVVSRDEAVEIVAGGGGTMPASLAALWAERWPRQAAAEKLCKAVAGGEAGVEALRSSIAECPEAVKAGAVDELSGESPLHLAASMGNVVALEALLAAGAPVDAPDGEGITALTISRKFEQCEAEGVLLRAGAADPNAAELDKAAPPEAAAAEKPAVSAAEEASPSSDEQQQAPSEEPSSEAFHTPMDTLSAVSSPAKAAADETIEGIEGAEVAAAAAAEPAVPDSVLSVCGTDTSVNAADISSQAGDFDDSEYVAAAASPSSIGGEGEGAPGGASGGASCAASPAVVEEVEAGGNDEIEAGGNDDKGKKAEAAAAVEEEEDEITHAGVTAAASGPAAAVASSAGSLSRPGSAAALEKVAEVAAAALEYSKEYGAKVVEGGKEYSAKIMEGSLEYSAKIVEGGKEYGTKIVESGKTAISGAGELITTRTKALVDASHEVTVDDVLAWAKTHSVTLAAGAGVAVAAVGAALLWSRSSSGRSRRY